MLARGRDAFAARFNLRRSAATFLRNAAISSLCSGDRSRALRSRAFSRFRESTSPRSALIVSLPGFGPCKASRSWKTSMRSDMIVLRLRESTPASESSFSSRATSDWKNSASFAARRTSLTSSIAALSLSRPLSSCVFRRPARERAARSAWSNSSARASAAAARARSVSARACACSYRDCQSRGSDVGAAMGGDQSPPSASVSVRVAPKSSSRIAMCATIANRRRRYQCLVEGVQNDVSPLHHRVTERFHPASVASAAGPEIRNHIGTVWRVFRDLTRSFSGTMQAPGRATRLVSTYCVYTIYHLFGCVDPRSSPLIPYRHIVT